MIPKISHSLILAAAAAAALAASPVRADVPAAPTRVLVIPFSALNVSEGQQWISKGVQETIVADFGRAGAAPIAFQGQVIVEDNATAVRLARQASADLAVRGAAQVVGDSVRLTAQLIDAKTGDTLHTASATGPVTDLLALEDQLSAQLRGLPPTAQAAQQGTASAPATAPEYQQYQQPQATAQPQVVVVSPSDSGYPSAYPAVSYPSAGYYPYDYSYYNPYYYSGYYPGYSYPYFPFVISASFGFGHDHHDDHGHDNHGHDNGHGGSGQGNHGGGGGGSGHGSVPVQGGSFHGGTNQFVHSPGAGSHVVPSTGSHAFSTPTSTGGSGFLPIPTNSFGATRFTQPLPQSSSFHSNAAPMQSLSAAGRTAFVGAASHSAGMPSNGFGGASFGAASSFAGHAGGGFGGAGGGGGGHSAGGGGGGGGGHGGGGGGGGHR